MRGLAAGAVLLAACGGMGSETPATTLDSTTAPSLSFPVLGEPVDIPPLPELDPGSVAVGQVLYAAHCARCHGTDLKGDADWMIPKEDGTYLPPPHDASGHTWHHSDQLLISIVLDGVDFFESNMPVYGGVLTEEEVLSILDYIKSTWGPEEREVNWHATVREAVESGS